MLMKAERVWKYPCVEHGLPVYLNVSLEGRWTLRQFEALKETLAEDLRMAGCELYTLEITSNHDTVRWFLVRVRDKQTGAIRPVHTKG